MTPPRTLPAPPPPLAVDLYEPEGEVSAAVLFVHGFGAHRRGQKALHFSARLPRAGVRFLALDLQGHGDSGGRFEELTIGRSVEDVLRVAAQPEFAQAPRRALVGSSFGGLVAAWAAVESPHLIDRLVLLAPAFRFVERHSAQFPAEEIEAWRRGELLHVRNEWLDVHLENDILHEACERPVEELARRLDRPTLILHGRRDEAVPARESLRFARRAGLPELEIILLEGADHRFSGFEELLTDEILRVV